MWSVAIRVRPRVFTRRQRRSVGQAFARHQPLEGSQPMFVIARAIVGLAAIGRCLQFFGECGGPLLPGEVTFRRKPQRKSEGLSLPRLGERRSVIVKRQGW